MRVQLVAIYLKSLTNRGKIIMVELYYIIVDFKEFYHTPFSGGTPWILLKLGLP
jgi:hypothetical protein